MQTILGSNGQIGQELAKALYAEYTHDIRLVSRKPHQVHATDELVAADLLQYDQALQAIAGSEIVYFTVGLPYSLWDTQFRLILQNVIKASQVVGAKLVYFDNTYMYPKDDTVQVESTPIAPVGPNSTIRAEMTKMVLDAIETDNLEAVIVRAPEFYGPGQTQSITNSMLLDPIKQGKRGYIPVSRTTLRTLIWTPDASRAMALVGNTPTAYGQTWHLPTATSLSYQDMVQKAERILKHEVKTLTVPMWAFKVGSWFKPEIKNMSELLPRYQYDNVFNSDKFQKAFPDFEVTSIDQGLMQIFKEAHDI
ncbi:NAD-dependent epimerase/dehydratase family protein [Weissella viridescens]|uniref:NAD-dependent epimerase/dehydratase family protein n=1 Tax=Weissella viridescens TaxID=1629 RepID=A0A3P2RCB2_WEIVI|nr:NAD-dependent epimerase/dehydratase family protein [Weissella viridescens]RRG17416.1 NAD-dependent epimerase/dehydratase family protein [Weissella viridescens]